MTGLTQLFIDLIWKGLLGAGLASAGFGVLFNVRGKNLYLSALTGAAGGMVYLYFNYLRWEEGLSCFMAALVIGILGEIFARRMKTTVTTFTACALIPLVPGGTAYEMMVDFATGEVVSGGVKMIDMFAISGMLAFGILVVSTMTRFFFYSRKKVRSTTKRLIESERTRKARRSYPHTHTASVHSARLFNRRMASSTPTDPSALSSAAAVSPLSSSSTTSSQSVSSSRTAHHTSPDASASGAMRHRHAARLMESRKNSSIHPEAIADLIAPENKLQADVDSIMKTAAPEQEKDGQAPSAASSSETAIEHIPEPDPNASADH